MSWWYHRMLVWLMCFFRGHQPRYGLDVGWSKADGAFKEHVMWCARCCKTLLTQRIKERTDGTNVL